MVVGICTTGLLYLVHERRGLTKRAQDAALFLHNVQEYLRSNGQSANCYSWLLRHSHQMQTDMGALGVMGYFSAPFATYTTSNWPIVLNALTEMRQWADQGFGVFGGPHRLFFEYGATLQEAILRYAGVLELQAKELTGSIHNPFIWFRHGVQLILLLPLTILRSLGLHSIPELRILSGRTAIRITTGLAAVVGFLGSIASIIGGWDNAVSFTKSLVKMIHR
jgi:hypothetical protein